MKTGRLGQLLGIVGAPGEQGEDPEAAGLGERGSGGGKLFELHLMIVQLHNYQNQSNSTAETAEKGWSRADFLRRMRGDFRRRSAVAEPSPGPEPLLLTQFATVFVFLCLAIGFIFVSQIISFLLRPKNPYPSKQTSYECGEEIEGSPWIQFNVRFYLVALFFIVFDVEIIFILPWAVVFKEMVDTVGPLAFWDMAVFVGILVVGLAYVWVKGDLQWVKGLTRRTIDEASPLSQYSSGRLLGHRADEVTRRG